MPPATPRRVVGTFYALTGLFNLSASLIWGVNTLFLLAAGLSVLEAFTANAAFTAGQVLFEIPTGVLADTRGRRLSFLLSAATLFVGTVAYVALAQTDAAFGWWLAASVLLGLGFTFYSGATEAWFVDALQAAGGPTDLDPYFARNAQVFAASMLVGTVGGGLLGTVDLDYPYVARAALLLVLLAAGALLMRDLGFEKRSFVVADVPHEVADVARASWRHGWRNPPVRLLMLLSLLHMGFLIWGWYAWQPHFLDLLGRDLVWVAGVVAALVGLLMILGNQAVRLLHRRVRRPTLLVWGSAGLAAAMVGVGLARSFYPAVALFLFGMLCFGVVQPAKQAALHRLIPSRQRATIVSFDGLLGSAGGVVSQPSLAWIAQERGYAAGYLVGGAVLALGVPVALRFRRQSRDGDAAAGGHGFSPDAASRRPMPQLTPLVTRTELPLPVFRRGKVRDVYEVGGDRLLMVATDRISAFDVVLEPGIPDKGACLTQISNFWFSFLDDVENHLVATRTEEFPPELRAFDAQLRGHAVLVERLEPLPVECIVRGYLAGSGWKEYKKSGTVCGIPLPPGLTESAQLPQPIFTPSTKAETGHDENIPFEEAARIVGQKTAEWLRDTSLRIYQRAAAYAKERGIILADTKFEFGRRKDGTIVLMDEVLTPDSSRFWPADEYAAGRGQPSFDKQYVRDYLETLDWDKTPPGPRLPADIVEGTSRRYKEAYERLTGTPFAV